MSDRPLLPARGRRGPAFALLAVLLFVMTITAASGLGLFNGSRLLIGASGERHIVQLPGALDDSAALEDFLSEQPGVTTARAMPAEELRGTLEQWLGPAATQADLPLPAIVDVKLDEGTDPLMLRSRLATRFPDAQLTSQRALMGPVLGALRTVSLLGLGLVVAIGIAAAVAVTLATRAALTANRKGIAILHGMGATDRQVAASFERRIALDALVGGTIGTVVALAVLAGLLTLGGGDLAFLMGGQSLLGLADLLVLLLLPLLAAAMAFMVARTIILRDLRVQP